MDIKHPLVVMRTLSLVPRKELSMSINPSHFKLLGTRNLVCPYQDIPGEDSTGSLECPNVNIPVKSYVNMGIGKHSSPSCVVDATDRSLAWLYNCVYFPIPGHTYS